MLIKNLNQPRKSEVHRSKEKLLPMFQSPRKSNYCSYIREYSSRAIFTYKAYIIDGILYDRGPHPPGRGLIPVGPVRTRATQQKVSLSVMHLNRPKTVPHHGVWKNWLPQNWPLVLGWLGTAAI